MTAKNVRQFEFRLGKLGLALFIAGLTMLVFSGFLVGVQIGRHIDTYPEAIARGIPARLLRFVGLSSHPGKADIPVGKPGVDLFDVAAGDGQAGKTGQQQTEAEAAAPVGSADVQGGLAPKEGLDVPAVAGSVPLSSRPATAASEAGSSSSGGTQTAVKPPFPEAKAKQDKSQPEMLPDSRKESAPVTNGKYTVQVVSFREKEKAEALSQKIRGFGYRPQISRMDIDGKGQWFRVTIAGLETKQDAEKAVNDLTARIKGLNCVVKSK